MRLFLIRHGRTKGNTEHRYVGSTDEGILPEERQRLLRNGEALMELLGGERTVVYTSPMKRCLETEELLFEKDTEKPPVHIVTDFREMNFGEFEYKNYRELTADSKTAAVYQAYIDSGGETAFPGGENRRQFEKRTVRAAEAVLARHLARRDSERDQNLVFIVHGGTIMAIMDCLSDPHKDYFDWSVQPGEGYAVDVVNGEKYISLQNPARI